MCGVCGCRKAPGVVGGNLCVGVLRRLFSPYYYHRGQSQQACKRIVAVRAKHDYKLLIQQVVLCASKRFTQNYRYNTADRCHQMHIPPIGSLTRQKHHGRPAYVLRPILLLSLCDVVVRNIGAMVLMILRRALQRSKLVRVGELASERRPFAVPSQQPLLSTVPRLWPKRVHRGHELDEILKQAGA